MIAEGKASDKKIYVKKLQEKRTAINIIYNMTTEKMVKEEFLPSLPNLQDLRIRLLNPNQQMHSRRS